MQWTDRIRQVKIFLVLAAVVIAVTSLVISNIFVKDLAKEERNKMEVWAEAMRSFNMADETTDQADDAYCEQLLKNYQENPDPHKHDAVPLEELAQELGIAL